MKSSTVEHFVWPKGFEEVTPAFFMDKSHPGSISLSHLCPGRTNDLHVRIAAALPS